jgi:hypothetical protein
MVTMTAQAAEITSLRAELAAANERASRWEHQSGVNLGHYEAEKAMRHTITAERDGQQARADLSDGMIQSLVDQKKALIAERDEARKSWKEAADGWVFETNRIDALLPHLTATELALSASQEREKALRVALAEMAPHVAKIARAVRINNEMGRVVTGQTEAAEALAEIFSRAVLTQEGGE